MIIRWQDNVGGTVRNQAFAFRRQPFLNNYIGVSIVVITPDCILQVSAPILAAGLQVRATIDSSGQRVDAAIEDLLQVNATIDATGQQVRAKIDSVGQRVGTKLCQ